MAQRPEKLRSRLKFSIPLLLSLVCLGYLFWPTNVEVQIKAILDRAVTEAHFAEALTPIEARIRAKALVELLDDQVDVHYRSDEFEHQKRYSRGELLNLISSAIVRISSAQAGYSQLKFERIEKTEARASLFLIAEWKRSEEEETAQAAEQVEVTFRRTDKWRVTSIETFPR
jgi:hypothetical protein